MPQEIPTVFLLKPFRIDQSQPDSEVLSYPLLQTITESHIPYEAARWDRFMNADDPLQEVSAARQLANQYLLQTALKATTCSKLTVGQATASRRLWAERFTAASAELYGAPDPVTARALFAQQELELQGGEPAAELKQHFYEGAKALSQSLESEYGTALAIFEPFFEAETTIDILKVASLFSEGLDCLKANDARWADWTVALTDDSKLSADTSNKTINVGRYRVPIKGSKLKGLFAHEVLVHALRAVNAESFLTSEQVPGLPGFLDAEEGLGKLVEYGFSGKSPQGIIDKYVDIAAALGIIFDHPLTRPELQHKVLERAVRRAELKGKDPDLELLEKQAWAHVNRIYRGSRGDQFSGVFPKDLTYYRGFQLMGEYVKSQLATGMQSADLLRFLLQCSFDPTNSQHLAEIAKARSNLT